MDIISAKLGANMAVKALEADGRIGSGEASRTYTFDGNLEGKIYVPYGEAGGFVKISDDMPDLYKFEKLEWGGENFVVGTVVPDLSVNVIEGTAENGELFGAKGYAVAEQSTPYVVVITDTLNSPIPSTGLYFMWGTDGVTAFFTKTLIIGGSVKPIDGKYLPKGTPWIEEGEMVEVLAETEGINDGADGDGTLFYFNAPLNLTAGKTYTINYNSVEYECVAQEGIAGSMPFIGLGNLTILGGTGNDEPFWLKNPSYEEGVAFEVVALDNPDELTISIYGEGEIAHKIDPRCLPAAGPKVIDLTKYALEDGNTLSSTILFMFISGGSSVEVAEDGSFWNDVDTNQNLAFFIDASAQNYHIKADGVTVVRDASSQSVEMISFSFYLYSGSFLKVTIILNNYHYYESDGYNHTQISVVVEPLTIGA